MSQPCIWITEKPNAAKDLIAGMKLAYGATATNQANWMRDGYFKMSNGDIVLPLRGHVLQSKRPGFYLPAEMAAIESARDFARFREFLPIIPDHLVNEPKPENDDGGKGKGGKKRAPSSGGPASLPYRTAKALFKGGAVLRTSYIINAGDIDREGQLIVDELLEDLGISPTDPRVLRLSLVSNRAEDIAEDLKARKFDKNGDEIWQRRAAAARARAFVDWVWGMNLSMTYQAAQRVANVSVGRVQTPVLNIVYQRDEAIRKFVPRDYFVPVITLRDGTEMRWFKRPDAAGTPGFDEEGRIIDKGLAMRIAQAASGGLKGICQKATSTDIREAPPLPFSLGALQAQAAREHGLTLDEVEAAAKALYTAKVISYVGTDCRFLPESMHADARSVMAQLANVLPGQAMGATLSLKSKAFNDKKVDEHFAIIPMAAPGLRAPVEMAVFRTIAKRYICQFYPDHIFRRHSLVGTWANDEFRATAREEVQAGWKAVEQDTETSGAREDNGGGHEVEVDADGVIERDGG